MAQKERADQLLLDAGLAESREAAKRLIMAGLVYACGPRGDWERVASRIDISRAKAVACVGGDGTAQEYASLAVQGDTGFAVIPAGSANDLLYSVPGGAPVFRSFEEKIAFHTRKVLRGRTARTDIICLNGERYCLNIGGTGMDIQVLKDALPLKKRAGGAAYFLSLIKNAATYRPEPLTLTVDGNSQTGTFLLLAICNGAYYGGRLRIAPTASINDSRITLCTVTPMPRPKLMALFPLVKPGWHTLMKEVSLADCEEVTLNYPGVKTINLDGNLYDLPGPLRFKLLPGAVRLIV